MSTNLCRDSNPKGCQRTGPVRLQGRRGRSPIEDPSSINSLVRGSQSRTQVVSIFDWSGTHARAQFYYELVRYHAAPVPDDTLNFDCSCEEAEQAYFQAPDGAFRHWRRCCRGQERIDFIDPRIGLAVLVTQSST